MKSIDIKDQPGMGVARTAALTVNGIRYRLFRSAVTVVVIAVAVAFLMNILSEGLIKQAMGRMAGQRIAHQRQAAVWAARLAAPGTIEEILREWTGGPATETPSTQAAGGAQQAVAYLDFFAGLDYGQQRLLLHGARSTEIFDRFRDAAERERFEKQLKTMKSLRLPTSASQFDEFVQNWPALRREVEKTQQDRAGAIRQVTTAVGNRSLMEALAEADGAFGDELREAGFVLEPAETSAVARQARQILQMEFLQKTIGQPEIRSLVAAYLDVLPGDVNIQTLWKLLANRSTAAWYLEKLREKNIAVGPLTTERLVELAALKQEERALARAQREAALVRGGILGIGERMSWLVLVSLLVCVVGIANAMLMSVTERFREIATLKCLGALDGVIMLMFVLEACVLGVAGGVVGALLGSVIGLGRMLVAFGTVLVGAIPVGLLFVMMGLSVALGIILAGLAAVYPSFKAARLAPMEAMRIE